MCSGEICGILSIGEKTRKRKTRIKKAQDVSFALFLNSSMRRDHHVEGSKRHERGDKRF